MKLNKKDKEIKNILDTILENAANGECTLKVERKNGDTKCHIEGDPHALLFVLWEIEETIQKQLGIDTEYLEILKQIRKEFIISETTKYHYEEKRRDV